MKKGKLNFKKSCAIFLPISVVTLSLAIAVPIASDIFKPTLNTVFGEGELQTETFEGMNTDYYGKRSKAEVTSDVVDLNRRINEEGIVLLKNDNLLPLAKNTKVAPFGQGFYVSASVSGSASWNGADISVSSLNDALAEKFIMNTELRNITNSAAVISILEAEGTQPMQIKAMGNYKRHLEVRSFDSRYQQYVNSHVNEVKDTVGILIINRGGYEGADRKMDGLDGGTAHELQLTKPEMDTLKLIKQNFKKAILVCSTTNIVEINDETSALCDAILWSSTTGTGGEAVLAEVLSGEVNPSGRTVNTWSKNFLNIPSSMNFGLDAGDYSKFGLDMMKYTNVTQPDAFGAATYVEYEEGIYVGYKYFETAYEEALKGNYAGFNYDNEVAYPFGYGLSYTSFNQRIVGDDNKKIRVNGNTISLDVEVTNTGTVAGKEAVQIYYGAPYTDFDKANKIEKASKNLIAFDKTRLLQPNESQIITLSFNIDEMSSYYTNRDNGDGTRGCYFLEKGNYNIYLGKNAHENYDTASYNNASDVYYDNSNIRPYDKLGQAKWDENGNPTNETKSGKEFKATTNLFEQCNKYMNQSYVTNFSRSDFKGTFPTRPTQTNRTLPKEYADEFNSYKYDSISIQDHPVLGNQRGSKARNTTPFKVEQKGINLSSMRGVDYNDEKWLEFINQLSFRDTTNRAQLGQLLGYGAYNTAALDALNKFSTIDFDGPNGYSTFGYLKDYKWMTYAGQPTTAATFNPRLAYERGKLFGQEGLANGVQGLYAPGANIHRNPFAGRCGEYVSEDPYITGVVCREIISGLADGGVFSYIKHFALNEQESNRNDMLMTWANEQTIRETYLKPFEMCVKEAKQKLNYIDTKTNENTTKVIRGCTGIMSAFNAIGPVMCSNNWYLLTGVLREQWGFEGAVITDYGPRVSRDAMLRSGNDFYLTAFDGALNTDIDHLLDDSTSITSLHAIRNAVKNMCYMIVNSGSYNGIAPGAKSIRLIATWEIWIKYVLTISLYLITLSLASIVLIKFIQDKKKNQNLITEENNETVNPNIESYGIIEAKINDIQSLLKLYKKKFKTLKKNSDDDLTEEFNELISNLEKIGGENFVQENKNEGDEK